MIEYNLIYQCRRCSELHIDKMKFETRQAYEYFLTKDEKRLHRCLDEKGIGVADLIGSGEVLIDR